jgi:hypothetical protein
MLYAKVHCCGPPQLGPSFGAVIRASSRPIVVAAYCRLRSCTPGRVAESGLCACIGKPSGHPAYWQARDPPTLRNMFAPCRQQHASCQAVQKEQSCHKPSARTGRRRTPFALRSCVHRPLRNAAAHCPNCKLNSEQDVKNPSDTMHHGGSSDRWVQSRVFVQARLDL